jgi:phage minor structural protein
MRLFLNINHDGERWVSLDFLKFPILFESLTDDHESNGLGAMSDMISGKVQRNTCQIPQANMVYPANTPLANQITNGMIIMVDMGPRDWEKRQLFRIVACPKSRQDSAIITITANHIWGDLSYIPLNPASNVTAPNVNAADAFEMLKDNAAWPGSLAGFTADTDISKVANIAWQGTSLDNINSAVIGADQAGDTPTNTIQAIYNAELRFNNQHLSILKRAGKDTGLVIKYGKNMTGLTEDNTTESTYNAIVPYATYTPTEVPVEGDGSEEVSGQGTVKYVGTGTISIYDDFKKGHHVVGQVRPGASYQVIAKATENTATGNTWYEIGPGQWIDETFWTYDKTNDYIINKVAGHGTISIGGDDDSDSGDHAGFSESYDAAGTITYAGRGGVALWTNYQGGHVSGQYLKNGTRWKVNRRAWDTNGHLWYCLGNPNSQWVDSQYFSLSKERDYASDVERGYLKIAGTVSVSQGPAHGFAAINWWHYTNMRFQYTRTSVDSAGTRWYYIGYNRGTEIWVSGDGINFTAAGTVEADPNQAEEANAKATGKIPVFNKPGGQEITTTQLVNGQSFDIDGQAESNGRTWYHIKDGWVDSSYFSFAGDADAEPGDGTDDSSESEEVEEQIITIDGLVLMADNVSPTEPIRAQVVDLTSYGIGNDQSKLRDVAMQYMRQYRFGQRNYSFTVNRGQEVGDYRILDEATLYDTVAVQDDELNIGDKAEANAGEWNILTHEFDSLTFGSIPITFEHLLGNMQNQLTKQVTSVDKKATHLFGRMHQIMKLQGDDQKAALAKLATDLGMDIAHNKSTISALQEQVESINATVDDVQSWITQGGGGVIQAVPNWQSPTELTATTPNGGKMVFSGAGLGYIGSDNILQTAIDSKGRVIAEQIKAGTIDGLTLTGATITGKSYVNSYGGNYHTVMSTDVGFGVYAGGDHKAVLTPDGLWLYNSHGGLGLLTGYDIAQLGMYMKKQGWGWE